MAEYIELTEKLKLSMRAGSRAILNTKKYHGTIYMEDAFSDNPKEMPYLQAAEILYIASEKEPEDVAPVVHGRWEWFEEWLPSTTEHPKECEDCGWLCGNCMRALEDMVGGYWDDPDEIPKLAYCPNCGARMNDA